MLDFCKGLTWKKTFYGFKQIPPTHLPTISHGRVRKKTLLMDLDKFHQPTFQQLVTGEYVKIIGKWYIFSHLWGFHLLGY